MDFRISSAITGHFIILISPSAFTTANDQCDDGWYQFDKICYWRSAVKKTWFQAQNACMIMEAKLGEPKTGNENLNIITVLTDNLQLKRYWLGGIAMGFESPWIWNSSRENITEMFWSPNEPNSYSNRAVCIEIGYRDSNWFDTPCSSELLFLCEKKIKLFSTDHTSGPTTAIMTSIITSPTSCKCACRESMATESHNYTKEDLDVMFRQSLEKTRKELSVNRSTLSSYIRSKTSAADSRKSSMAIGGIGVFCISVVLCLIVLADFPSIGKNLEICRKGRLSVKRRIEVKI